MKNFWSKGIAGIILLSVLALSCEKADEEEGGDECYTCTACTGQYAHLINDTAYCISGFDNRSDWEANKTAMEQQNSCTCE